VLVLGEAHRHREIEERIKLLERLRGDGAAIPAYAKNFAVVFGSAGLRAYLEERAHEALSQARSQDSAKDVDKKRLELASREEELNRAKAQVEHVKAQLDQTRTQLEQARVALDRERSQLAHERAEQQRQQQELDRLRSEQRARVIASVQVPVASAPTQTLAGVAPPPGLDAPSTPRNEEAEATTIGHRPQAPEEGEHVTSPIELREPEPLAPLDALDITPLPPPFIDHTGEPPPLTEISTEIHVAFDTATSGASTKRANGASNGQGNGKNGAHHWPADEETTGTAIIPPGSDPLTTDTQDLGDAVHDNWLDFAATGSTSVFEVNDGVVRLALLVNEHQARGFRGELDVRLLLHRVTTYPIITLVVGPPAALRVPSPTQLATVTLDIGSELDRQVLGTLARRFTVDVVVILAGAPIRSVRLSAPLADNAAYILRAADDHLRGIQTDTQNHVSFEHARDLVAALDYDLIGATHAEANEFRDDKLAQLQTAQQLRRAIAIARRFARPSREDYLICARSFPLTRWRELRRHVLESAVAWGIWMGPELAQVAVSEGLARSRRDLIVKLDAGFDELRRHPTAFDIDDDAADDNAKAIAEEARALGVEVRKKNGTAIKSEDVPIVSGSIEGEESANALGSTPTEQLVAMLDDKGQRVAAAAELCDRGPSVAALAAGPVIAAVKKMSRAEAVRILGKCVKFGPAAAQPLIEGLGSSKAFLRHGSALALALLRTEEGTQAVIDALINEPTEVWREIARALGQVGPSALMPLASYAGRLGDRMTAPLQERVAWAMSHVGVRGGKGPLEQMAAGQSVMAPIARQALALLDTAARDEVRVRPGAQASRDVTVNRAFSRRFFEALDAAPDIAQAALHDLDASGPMEMLDDSDLIVEDEDEAELDESDLIQT
jgi:TolA-binding protein